VNLCRIFEESSGFHYSDESLPFLDARGRGFRSRSEAMREAYRNGFTHAIHRGNPRAISGLVRLSQWDRADHSRWNGGVL